MDIAANVAAAPITTPTLVMAAQGQGVAIRATLAPRATSITRVVDVPGAGHWLAEENPGVVTNELLRFLRRLTGRATTVFRDHRAALMSPDASRVDENDCSREPAQPHGFRADTTAAV